MSDQPEITAILSALRDGDPDAPLRLENLIYPELRKLAQYHMGRERPDHTLQPTALVNEAYLRLTARDRDWKNRAHFFAVASQVMRQILVDYARQRQASKRGGAQQRLTLDDVPFLESEPDVQSGRLLALDDALGRLAKLDARQCRIVELRFFGGLTDNEIGEVLGLSSRTVQREWRLARAWLQSQIAD